MVKNWTFLFTFLLLILLSTVSSSAAAPAAAATICGEQEWLDHTVLCHMLDRLEQDAVGLAAEIHDWALQHGLLVDLSTDSSVNSSPLVHHRDDDEKEEEDIELQVTEYGVAAMSRRLRRRLGGDNKSSSLDSQSQQQQLPVVLAHGMGDSCFNSGMQHITAHVSQLLGGVYTVCIPTGNSQTEDTNNGYFLNMDASVQVFTDAVRNDPQLQHGFHAIGLSQGNNIIRGYLAKVNAPTIHTFLSINGVNAGVGAVPYCRPTTTTTSSSSSSSTLREQQQQQDVTTISFSMCELLMEQASKRAYTEFAQEHSFQANYWRDPRPSMAELYHKYGQLAIWNNEAGFVNETLRDNWAKTNQFVWVMATEDGMVWPKEGEQWGMPDPVDPFNHVLLMKETAWYKEDLFGLKTAEEAGKNFYESFEGDHLRFTMKDFDHWIHTYLDQSHQTSLESA